MAVAPATRRDVAAHGPSAGSGGGAEARAPYRRRRAHSHQPGLYSDKWGASCPDGGAEARGPRPPSEGWRSWSYEAGPAADTASARSVLPCMHLPAATPQPSPTRPSRQRPREGGNPPGGAASLPPHGRRASDPREERRPHARRWTQTPPCWRSSSVPPPGATPFSPICGRHPLGQPAQQGTQTAVNQRRIIQQPRQGRPRQETIAVLPPGQLQETTKKHKAILHRGINHTARLLTEAAKLFNAATPQPSPTWPSRQRPPAT